MNIELHVLEDGVDRGPIPSFETLTISPIFCDYGAISFTYPADGKKFNLLAGKDEIEVVPYLDGIRQPQLGGIVQEVSGDDVNEAAVFTFNGLGFLALLDEGRAFPRNWPGYDKSNPNWVFASSTPGAIMLPLIAAAKARGALPGVTTGTFTATHDSAGQPWAKTLSMEVKPNATMTEVVKALHDQGACEFEMYGRDLRIYNTDSLGVNRTVQAKPLTFRRGRDLSDSPRKISSRDVATVVLGAGKEDTGLYLEEVDAAAVTARRRIEGYISSGNISDEGTLQAYVETVLAQSVNSKMEKTHGLAFGKKSPRPVANFDVGDWAFSDVGRGLEKLRIKQWVLSVGSDGKIAGSVVMNDLFAEQGEKLARRLKAIESGAAVAGETQDPGLADVVNGVPPEVPQGLSAASEAYTDELGFTFAQVSASWLPVTENVDGTPITDLAGYLVRYSMPELTPEKLTVAAGQDTTVSWSPVPPNTGMGVEVLAFDKYGNYSAWSEPFALTTGADDTSPTAPSQPLVDNYLGLLRVRWDGEGADGLPLPRDFDHVEIHISEATDFTPTEATYAGFLRLAGSSFHAVAYGVPKFVKFIAVDTSGNESPASVQASASTSRVVGDDILDGAVGTLKLADLAVTNAKIGLLAVNDANIGNMNVGKLTAGIMNAEVSISGRFTTALTGQRREMNAIGFQAFNSANSITINLDGVNNLLTGIFQTALTGRRITIGAAGSFGDINFYAPSGKMAQFRAYTEVTGTEAIQFGIPIAGTSSLWNRINYNSSANGEYATYQSGTHEFMFDSAAPNSGKFYIFETTNRGAGAELLRVEIVKDNIRLYTGDRSTQGYLELRQGLTNGSWVESPNFNFVTALAGGVLWSGMLYYAINANGTNFGLEVQHGGGGYMPIKAGAFTVNSDERTKDGIADADFNALDLLRGSTVRKYRSKFVNRPKKVRRFEKEDGSVELIEDGIDEEFPMPAPTEEIGLVAQEAPQILRSESPNGMIGIDLYRYAALLHKAVQELDVRLGGLEEEGKTK